MADSMLGFALVTLLLLPNLVLAFTSKAGNHAGYYVLAGIFALAVIAGVWPVGFYIYGVVVVVGAAVLFRDRLRIGAFFAQRARSRRGQG